MVRDPKWPIKPEHPTTAPTGTTPRPMTSAEAVRDIMRIEDDRQRWREYQQMQEFMLIICG
jgi:hypothetical protein